MEINPINGLIFLIVLVFSAILHEVAHGYVADRFGDPTARIMGRLTLNPIPHIDPIMTILLPLITYISSGGTLILGGAKPVPIDPYNLKEGRKDVALVALAGPLTNIILAILGSLLLHGLIFLAPSLPNDLYVEALAYLLKISLSAIAGINLLLAIFNLLPIPPLDGSKIFALVLPDDIANMYLSFSSMGMLILFFLLLFPVAGFSLSQAISHWYLLAKGLLGI